jgi:hypothetical protein
MNHPTLGEVFLAAIRQPATATASARIDAILDAKDSLGRIEDLVMAGELSLEAMQQKRSNSP